MNNKEIVWYLFAIAPGALFAFAVLLISLSLQ